MLVLDPGDPLAAAVVDAVHGGDLAALGGLLADHPDLATARIGDPDRGMSRTLLHVATDWPGHFPDNPATVRALLAAGGDVNAAFTGPHAETPLHWAASSDDVEVIDALLDGGADIDASGAVIANGTPLTDAVAFGQWAAARRLAERGATVRLREAAALGFVDRVEGCLAEQPAPTPEDVTQAFWYACHGGQRATAELLLGRGAELSWVSFWDSTTPLDAAIRSEATDLASWLRARGAVTAAGEA